MQSEGSVAQSMKFKTNQYASLFDYVPANVEIDAVIVQVNDKPTQSVSDVCQVMVNALPDPYVTAALLEGDVTKLYVKSLVAHKLPAPVTEKSLMVSEP